MYRQSQRTGYRNWELYDRVEPYGNGSYKRGYTVDDVLKATKILDTLKEVL